MAKKGSKRGNNAADRGRIGSSATSPVFTRTPRSGKPSVLLDTRVIYCGDNLEQLAAARDPSNP